MSAANVDVGRQQEINRTQLNQTWKFEPGLPKEQMLGDAWYKASKQKLQRGHLTPADCMEFGADKEEAKKIASDTFYFSNAVPQAARMNGKEWGMLEQYIGKEGLKSGNGRLCVFTGPVLMHDDPLYRERIEGQTLQLPRYLWKVVFYRNRGNVLCRIAFIMGQGKQLEALELVEEKVLERFVPAAELPFADLGKQKTYQINVKMLEKLIKMKFPAAVDTFKNKIPQALLLEAVETEMESVHTRGVLLRMPKRQRFEKKMFRMSGLVL